MNDDIDLSLMMPAQKKALQDMVFGEGASSDNDTVKMIIKSALSRYLSGKSEFGGPTMQDLLKKGYYAVSNPNTPYKQAVSGQFPDIRSKARYAEIGKLMESILGDKAYSKDDPQFYFKDEEAGGLKKKLRPRGRVGPYMTYSY